MRALELLVTLVVLAAIVLLEALADFEALAALSTFVIVIRHDRNLLPASVRQAMAAGKKDFS
jgi:hypothetical protein